VGFLVKAMTQLFDGMFANFHFNAYSETVSGCTGVLFGVLEINEVLSAKIMQGCKPGDQY
jgi:hypothetical protein